MYEKIGELLEEQLTQNCMEAISICIEDNHSDIFTLAAGSINPSRRTGNSMRQTGGKRWTKRNTTYK